MRRQKSQNFLVFSLVRILSRPILSFLGKLLLQSLCTIRWALTLYVTYCSRTCIVFTMEPPPAHPGGLPVSRCSWTGQCLKASFTQNHASLNIQSYTQGAHQLYATTFLLEYILATLIPGCKLCSHRDADCRRWWL